MTAITHSNAFHMSLHDVAQIVAAKHLGSDAMVNGISTDTRTLQPGELFIALNGPNFDAHAFAAEAMAKGAVACLLEKNMDVDNQLIVDSTHTALGQLARAWRQHFDYPLFAVTGSNGKTTVKEMLASILSRNNTVMATQGNLNNDIGVPLTLFRMDQHYAAAVIEMGANHMGEIRYLTSLAQPDIAIVTNIGSAHLQGFGGIENTARAKAEIFSGLAENGSAIINADDRFYQDFRQATASHNTLSFALDNKQADIKGRYQTTSQGSALSVTTPVGKLEIQLSLLGRHNAMNALAAIAACIAAEIPLSQIRDGLEALQPVQGRLQLKTGINQSRIIDDTYNANPTSLNAAIDVLQGFDGRRLLALGDMAELGEKEQQLHTEAGEYARAHGVDALYACGTLAAHAARVFDDKGFSYQQQEDMIAALRSELSQEVTLLVKGSRSMHMEHVVNQLTQAEG